MNSVLYISEQIQIPTEELKFTFSRSSGPGGQNVNKVNSKVTLHWDVVRSPSLPEPVRERFLARYRTRVTSEGLLILSSQQHRDQIRNRQDCIERLERLLHAIAVPPKRRRATRPTRASRERRLTAKRQQADKKRLRRDRPNAHE